MPPEKLVSKQEDDMENLRVHLLLIFAVLGQNPRPHTRLVVSHRGYSPWELIFNFDIRCLVAQILWNLCAESGGGYLELCHPGRSWVASWWLCPVLSLSLCPRAIA